MEKPINRAKERLRIIIERADNIQTALELTLNNEMLNQLAKQWLELSDLHSETRFEFNGLFREVFTDPNNWRYTLIRLEQWATKQMAKIRDMIYNEYSLHSNAFDMPDEYQDMFTGPEEEEKDKYLILLEALTYPYKTAKTYRRDEEGTLEVEEIYVLDHAKANIKVRAHAAQTHRIQIRDIFEWLLDRPEFGKTLRKEDKYIIRNHMWNLMPYALFYSIKVEHELEQKAKESEGKK
jgi:hypothetical protein